MVRILAKCMSPRLAKMLVYLVLSNVRLCVARRFWLSVPSTTRTPGDRLRPTMHTAGGDCEGGCITPRGLPLIEHRVFDADADPDDSGSLSLVFVCPLRRVFVGISARFNSPSEACPFIHIIGPRTMANCRSGFAMILVTTTICVELPFVHYGGLEYH